MNDALNMNSLRREFRIQNKQIFIMEEATIY